MPDYVVLDGDCVTSLAAQFGLLPKTIWDHPRNSALRKQRKDPNVLLPSDELFIPELTLKSATGSTESRHAFVRKSVHSKLNLRLVRNGKPRAGKAYTIVVDGRSLTGTTDGDGWVRQPIPPGARFGTLTLTATGETISVSFGSMDPLDHIAGVQRRLRNLGCYQGEISGDLDEDTSAAIRCFQAQHRLPLTGVLDASTRQTLKSAHGS